MKKTEELRLYTPQPVRPNLDARLCMSVADGEGKGRYIKGKTLIVAVWDKCKSPLAVWRFYGDYWTGEQRKAPEDKATRARPLDIRTKDGRALHHRDVAATKEESELLRSYFGDNQQECLMDIVSDALMAHERKRRAERDARQAEETERRFKALPEPAETDLQKQILAVCYDAVYLWVTPTKKFVVTPGGVGRYVPVQQVRCDSCGGEYIITDRKLKHKSIETCK